MVISRPGSRPLAAALVAICGALALPNAAGADEGAALYTELECAGCHEYAAISGFEVAELHAIGERYDETALAALLASPPDEMPIFDLSEAQRRAIARYLRTRFP